MPHPILKFLVGVQGGVKVGNNGREGFANQSYEFAIEQVLQWLSREDGRRSRELLSGMKFRSIQRRASQRVVDIQARVRGRQEPPSVSPSKDSDTVAVRLASSDSAPRKLRIGSRWAPKNQLDHSPRMREPKRNSRVPTNA